MVPTNAPGVIAFYQQRDAIWAATQLLWLIFPTLCLGAGWSIWLRDRALMWAGNKYYPALSIFTALYLMAGVAAQTPLEFYRDIIHLRSWRHSTPDILTWLSGRAVSAAAMVILGVVFVVAVFAVMRRSPKWWWAWCSAVSLLVLILAIEISQVVINPATQHQSALQDQQVLDVVHDFEQRCGLGNVPVFVGGDDTTVAGLGPAKRIVIAADDFATLPRRQLIAVLAHEFKHYRMGDDDWIALVAGAVVVLLGFGVVATAGPIIVSRRRNLVGASLSDIAAAPLVLALLMGSWVFAGSPFLNGLQRHLEFEADRFALELTHDNEAVAGLQQSMIDASTGPRLVAYYPFFEYIRANHPSDAERIRFALSYHPWREGRPGAFADVCAERR